MKPYLKGFHLLLETWQGGCNTKGWKLKEGSVQTVMAKLLGDNMGGMGNSFEGEDGAMSSSFIIWSEHHVVSCHGARVLLRVSKHPSLDSTRIWKLFSSLCIVQNNVAKGKERQLCNDGILWL